MSKEPIRVAEIIGKMVGGGVESVVMNYYRNIDKSKVQFDFICDDDSTNIPYEEIEKLGGKVILIPPYQKVFKYHKELKRILKENKYKIVHSHINTLSFFPLFAAKKAGVPVRIAHSHSLTNKKEFKRNLLKLILRPLSKIYATDYFSCSELAGRWQFGDKAFNKGKIYLMNNAIDIEKFKYNPKIRKEIRKELNISEETLVIGHIGRFVETKNHTFLIDVFNKLVKQNKNVILILVGQGPLQAKIKEKVHNLKLDDKVKFLGQRNDSNKLYQAIDLFVLPSLYEGLGLVLIEAQTSGLKCICSDEVPKEAKITNLVNYLNLNINQQEWAKKIIHLTKDKKRNDYSKQIKDAGYDIISESKKLEEYYLKKWSG